MRRRTGARLPRAILGDDHPPARRALPDLDYGDLDEVQDGVLAQVAYEEAIAPGTSAYRRETIRRNLLRYCERDTLAMVRMVEYFQ